jgi:hypothetical protein
MQQTVALISNYRSNSEHNAQRSTTGTTLGGAIEAYIQTASRYPAVAVISLEHHSVTGGFNWIILSIYTTPALAATLSNIIDGLSFPSTLRDPRSQRASINNHWWFTFSIYAIETHDLERTTTVTSRDQLQFLATSSLPSTSFFNEEE